MKLLVTGRKVNAELSIRIFLPDFVSVNNTRSTINVVLSAI